MKKFSIFPLVIVTALLSWSTSFAAITYDYSIVPPFNRYIEAEAIVGENMMDSIQKIAFLKVFL